MAVEALAWPNPPALTDNVDGTQNYAMGCAFTAVGDQSCPGVQWRVPDTVEAPSGGVHAAMLFEDVSGTRIGYQEFVPVPGDYQDVLFDAGSVSLVDGTSYVVTVYTLHYVFTSASVAGVSTPSGSAVATEGRLGPFNGGAALAPRPADVSGATFYVSPLITVGTVAPAEGSVELAVDIAAAAAGSRPSGGTTAVLLALAPAVAGSRPSAGGAALDLALAAVPVGGRPASGTAALDLNLALTAAGGKRSRGAEPRIETIGPQGRIVSMTRNIPWEV